MTKDAYTFTVSFPMGFGIAYMPTFKGVLPPKLERSKSRFWRRRRGRFLRWHPQFIWRNNPPDIRAIARIRDERTEWR